MVIDTVFDQTLCNGIDTKVHVNCKEDLFMIMCGLRFYPQKDVCIVEKKKSKSLRFIFYS